MQNNKQTHQLQKLLKNLAVLLLIGGFIFAQTQPAFAEQSTSSAEPDAGVTQAKEQEATQKLKERIEKIVEEKKEQIENAVNDKSHQKKGIIGEVARLTKETITIHNQKGTQIISLNDSMVIVKDSKVISIDKIAVGDWLVVMGWVEEDNFLPKRIIVYSQSLRPKNYSVALGTITAITKNDFDFMSRSQSESIKFTIDKKTEFQDYKGKAVNKSLFEENTQALLIGYQEKDSKIASILRSLAQNPQEDK